MPAAILHLLGTAQPEGAGIARIVRTLASGLDPDRYAVHAWFLGPPGPLIDDLRSAGAVAESVEWNRGIRDLPGAVRFRRHLGRHDFAIVHQHFGARSVRGMVRMASNARLVVHLHGCTASARISAGGADRVIAASRAIARGIPDMEPLVVYAGVEMPGESIAPAASEDIVIGAACRLVAGKGLLDLLRAAAPLCAEFPDLRLEIAGDGPQREDLEKEQSRLKLDNRVRFSGWQRDTDQMYRRWSIFVAPSHEEGFGMAALEAMAAGLPVVATSVGGLPEIVEDGQTGFLVPPGDVATLTERLRFLITEAALRRKMGAAGKERARRHFSASRMVAEISALYDSLI